MPFKSTSYPSTDPYVVDLAGDGRRLLLVPFACRPGALGLNNAPVSHGVLVLERVGEDLRAADFVPVPSSRDFGGWTFEDGTLTVESSLPNGSPADEVYVWNGHYFQR